VSPFVYPLSAIAQAHDPIAIGSIAPTEDSVHIIVSAPVSDDSIFLHESAIRGHHIFKGIWTPRTGEIVQVQQEAGNPHDRNTVALLKADGTVVGYVPSSFLLGSLGQQSLLTLLGPQQ